MPIFTYTGLDESWVKLGPGWIVWTKQSVFRSQVHAFGKVNSKVGEE